MKQIKYLIVLLFKNNKKSFVFYFLGLFLTCGMYTTTQIVISFANRNLVSYLTNTEIQLLINSIVFSLIAVISTCGIYPLFTYFFNVSTKKVIMDYRLIVFNHISKIKFYYFDDIDKSDVIVNFNQDITIIEKIFSYHFDNLITVLVYGISTAVSIFILDWKISLIIVALGVISALINMFFTKTFRKLTDEQLKRNDQVNKIFHEIERCLSIVKIFNIGNLFFDKLTKKIELSNQQQYKIMKNQLFIDNLNLIINKLITIMVFSIGLYMATKNWMTIGNTVAIIGLMPGVIGMFTSTGNIIIQLQTTIVGLNRIQKLMDYPLEDDVENMQLTNEFAYKKQYADSSILLSCEDVCFAYHQDHLVLNHVSFEIKTNEKVALLGKSGCGKSTLIKLLLGFYSPGCGEIYYDQREINSYPVRQLRETISYIHNPSFMLHDTLYSNITMGNNNLSISSIEEMAKMVEAQEFITKKENQYEWVYDDGLSGGEIQKIQLVRALLKKQAKLFIFDEATSAIDLSAEEAIIDHILTEYQNIAMLFVTHRLSILKKMDKILYMEDGKISAVFTPDELSNSQNGFLRLLDIILE